MVLDNIGNKLNDGRRVLFRLNEEVWKELLHQVFKLLAQTNNRLF